MVCTLRSSADAVSWVENFGFCSILVFHIHFHAKLKPMSIVTASSIPWKYAIGGAFVACMFLAPMIWWLTRQCSISTEEPPAITETFPWKSLAMGSAATILLQWIFSRYCRKSRQSSSNLPDPIMMTPGPVDQPPKDLRFRACCGSDNFRDVQSQSPTTYTALRGVSKPRFQLLPDESWG